MKNWNYYFKCKNFGIFYLVLKLAKTGVFQIFTYSHTFFLYKIIIQILWNSVRL